jgi:hypothetical protein
MNYLKLQCGCCFEVSQLSGIEHGAARLFGSVRNRHHMSLYQQSDRVNSTKPNYQCLLTSDSRSGKDILPSFAQTRLALQKAQTVKIFHALT